jgi:hypothetical protein
MVIQMLKVNRSVSKFWVKFSPRIIKKCNTLSSYNILTYNATNPFLQVKVLEILSHLQTLSNELYEVLIHTVSLADNIRSKGMEFLLQAIYTIGFCWKKIFIKKFRFYSN